MGLFSSDDEDDETPKPADAAPAAEPKQMSNDDMIAAALISLAPGLVGGLLGGKRGAYAGAAAGTGAAGHMLQNQADIETKAAADAAIRKKDMDAFEKKETFKANLKPKTDAKVDVREYEDAKGNTRLGVMGKDGKLVKTDADETVKNFKPEKAPKDISVAERNTLQNQYDRDLNVRKNRLVFSSFNEAQTYAAEKSPAADLSLTIAYFKANDPTSIVKESEAETAAALGGLENRAKAWFAKNAGEGGLTDAQRADLVRAIELKAQTAAKDQETINGSFTKLAGRRGVSNEDLRLASSPEFVKKDEVKAPLSPEFVAALNWAKDPKNVQDPHWKAVVEKLKAAGVVKPDDAVAGK
jgi:hypothetical protein